MHELSLAERLIELIEESCVQQTFQHVREIHLEVGSLAGVEVEALRLGIEAAGAGTVAEGAILHISTPKGRAYCLDCSRDIEISAYYEPCPLCGGHHLEISGGDRLILKHLEVE